jgi:hypothetical protein
MCCIAHAEVSDIPQPAALVAVSRAQCGLPKSLRPGGTPLLRHPGIRAPLDSRVLQPKVLTDRALDGPSRRPASLSCSC